MLLFRVRQGISVKFKNGTSTIKNYVKKNKKEFMFTQSSNNTLQGNNYYCRGRTGQIHTSEKPTVPKHIR